jgi:tyrosyl-tRNA synthetase
LIAGGGAKLNGESVTDEAHAITLTSGEIRISSGKKKHGVLKPA